MVIYAIIWPPWPFNQKGKKGVIKYKKKRKYT